MSITTTAPAPLACARANAASNAEGASRRADREPSAQWRKCVATRESAGLRERDERRGILGHAKRRTVSLE